VTTRTVRNDIDRLRELGYPVDATRGPAGHYQLGVGAKLPPLLLDDEEAVAVAVGLRTGAGVAGMADSSGRALTKLEQVLPHRRRRQVNAINRAMSKGPDNTGSNVEDPEIDPATLTTIAACIRDEHYVRFDYSIPTGALMRGAGSGRRRSSLSGWSWQRSLLVGGIHEAADVTDALRDAELLANAVAAGSRAALADYATTRDALSMPLFGITDAIAALDWDLDQIRTLHQALNQAMKLEVEHILALGDAAPAAPALADLELCKRVPD